MTEEELEKKIREVLPGAQLELDNEGQLIIYTNLYPLPNGELSKRHGNVSVFNKTYS